MSLTGRTNTFLRVRGTEKQHCPGEQGGRTLPDCCSAALAHLHLELGLMTTAHYLVWISVLSMEVVPIAAAVMSYTFIYIRSFYLNMHVILNTWTSLGVDREGEFWVVSLRSLLSPLFKPSFDFELQQLNSSFTKLNLICLYTLLQ